MKLKKWLALLCAVALLAALATGCGGTSDKDDDDKSDGGKTTTTAADGNGDGGNADNNNDSGSQDDTNKQPQGIQGLTATKIGSVQNSYLSTADGGLYYKGENGKYGILTLDGKSDTGAIYADCSGKGRFFCVTDKTAEDMTRVEELNSYGMVDAMGKEIVPARYAAFNMVGDYFVQAYAVTELAEGEEDGLVYYSESFTFTPNEDSVWFKGTWCVYDVRTGKTISGLSGDYKTSLSADGNLIVYVSEEREYRVMNEKGEEIPQNAKRFDNGYYVVSKDDTYTVYNSDREAIFTGKDGDYEPYSSFDNYLIASKYTNDGMRYVLMNLKGEIISAEFNASPFVYGNVVLVDDKLYAFDGTMLFEGPISYVRTDATFGKALLLESEDGVITCIDDLNTVLWQGDKDAVITYAHLLEKENQEGLDAYYCIADKDYTIVGSDFDRWLVRVTQPDYTYDLVDTISGETIIRGYSSYTSVDVDGCLYVYAKKEGVYDIYLVK